MSVAAAVFTRRHVEAALSPVAALEAVREAFVAYARGEWTMPAKVYVDCAPDGDFRAMPAAGGGYAVLKWVTSFPGNPDRGLPTVTGAVLLSDARTGELRAMLDAASVTAARTGAAAVLAAETLASRSAARLAAVVGCGVNGMAVARTFAAHGWELVLYDEVAGRAEAAAAELPRARAAASLAEALRCDVVATVTPGKAPVIGRGTLRPGQHVSLMGADGPGKAEIAVEELLRTRIVCDEWTQASHNGDIARAAAAGRLERSGVAELGRVLLGEDDGRRTDGEITAFDSTGLAVQDLAVARAVYERYLARPQDPAFAGVLELDLAA